MKYVRIRKEAVVQVNENLSYTDAIAFGHELDAECCIEDELYIDVVDEHGEVVNESAWIEDGDSYEEEKLNGSRP
jgi:hypothetical protein